MAFKTIKESISAEPDQQPNSSTEIVLNDYSRLLAEVDKWYSRCQKLHRENISCAQGCSECCRGLFDITMLDAALLKNGFNLLGEDVRTKVRGRAEERLRTIQSIWPEFSHPYVLNLRPDEEREELMASDNDTPCILLDDSGRCLLYEYRPMTCRLHGLPLIDSSGEVLEEEWCTLNFAASDPLIEESLAGPFDRLLREEAELGRDFTRALLGRVVCELDTFIPTALLIDFAGFDWQGWIAGTKLRT